MNLICLFKGHKRGKTKAVKGGWKIKCKRCGYVVEYNSPMARLFGKEISLGFDGY